MPWTRDTLMKHFAGGGGTSERTTSVSPEDDVGPHIIHDGCDKASTGFDIVFIHGLRGSRIKTWSSGSCFWPRDLLSEDLERTRLITWGYDGDIANAFQYASQDSIYGHADTLLNDLSRIRQDDTTRPIIFICHSLGGLVVKDALIKAASHHSHQRDPDHAHIFEHTRGVIFLGTPHRGSGKEALGDFVAKAANLGLRKANIQLLRSLRPGSHVLEKQREEFITISKNFVIRCVKEELPTAVGMIVPEHSANMDDFSIRTGSIRADHIGMVKFRSVKDEGYQRILGWIKSMQSEILNTTANTSLSPEDSEEEDHRQSTPRLHMAAASPSAAYLQQVIRDSPPEALNAVDDNIHHRTPLTMAIIRNLPENVAVLLRAGADINARIFLQNEWWPPLFLAAVHGHAETIEALISNGRLDPNQTFSEINGNTPLHVASVNRRPAAARTLLRLGADPWITCDRVRWNDGWTALDCAVRNRDEEMITILEEAMKQRSQASLQPSIEQGGIDH